MPAVAPRFAGQTGEALLAIGAQPALERAQFQFMSAGDTSEGHTLFEVGAQLLEADRAAALARFQELDERWGVTWSDGRAWEGMAPGYYTNPV